MRWIQEKSSGGELLKTCFLPAKGMNFISYKSIPSTWNYSGDHTLTYPVDQETDFGFHRFPDPFKGKHLFGMSYP
jgi:hypothetical protein